MERALLIRYGNVNETSPAQPDPSSQPEMIMTPPRSPADLAAENARLKMELDCLRDDRETLKKTLQILIEDERRIPAAAQAELGR